MGEIKHSRLESSTELPRLEAGCLALDPGNQTAAREQASEVQPSVKPTSSVA